MCLVGLLLLLHRRLSEPRVRATSRAMDVVVLLWILATLTLGLVSIFTSMGHRDGETMLKLMSWVQHIATFRGGAAALIVDVPAIYKTTSSSA